MFPISFRIKTDETTVSTDIKMFDMPVPVERVPRPSVIEPNGNLLPAFKDVDILIKPFVPFYGLADVIECKDLAHCFPLLRSLDEIDGLTEKLEERACQDDRCERMLAGISSDALCVF